MSGRVVVARYLEEADSLSGITFSKSFRLFHVDLTVHLSIEVGMRDVNRAKVVVMEGCNG
jgi:hypothetical protein